MARWRWRSSATLGRLLLVLLLLAVHQRVQRFLRRSVEEHVQDTGGAAGLGQARSSLRAGKTAEEQEEEDVLRKLQEWSVFVYPPPAFDNESSLPNAHTFTSTVDRAYHYRHYFDLLQQHQTDDPAQADVYFITYHRPEGRLSLERGGGAGRPNLQSQPFLQGVSREELDEALADARDTPEMGELDMLTEPVAVYAQLLLRHVRQFGFWERRGGADHVLGIDLSDTSPLCTSLGSSNPMRTTWQAAAMVGFWGESYRSCHRLHRDILLPPVVDVARKPVVNLGYAARDMHLLSFVGRVMHPLRKQALEPFRDLPGVKLVTDCTAKSVPTSDTVDGSLVVKRNALFCVGSRHGQESNSSLGTGQQQGQGAFGEWSLKAWEEELFARTKFCLVPPANIGFDEHLWTALSYACVPVVTDAERVIAHAHFLPPLKRFAVLMRSSGSLQEAQSLHGELRAMPEKTYREYQQTGLCVFHAVKLQWSTLFAADVLFRAGKATLAELPKHCF